jgi:D-alanine-D-alanine ligase-like ATP-grasp enzyme
MVFACALEVRSNWILLPLMANSGNVESFLRGAEEVPTPALDIAGDDSRRQIIEASTQRVIETLGCRGIVVVTFIMSPNRARLFDVDFMPQLTAGSLPVTAAKLAGFEHEILLLNLLTSAHRAGPKT